MNSSGIVPEKMKGGYKRCQELKEHFSGVLSDTNNRQHEHASSSKPAAHHWRSQSAPDIDESLRNWELSPQTFRNIKKSWTQMKRRFSHDRQERQAILKRDVAQLEIKLQDQLAMRGALEAALEKSPACGIPVNIDCIPKKTENTIREIATLEIEVARLEQHLLLLYRKVFEQNLSTNCSELTVRGDPVSANSQSCAMQLPNEFHIDLKYNVVQRSHSSLSENSTGASLLLPIGAKNIQKQAENGVQRSQSSLSQVSSSSSGVKQSPSPDDSLNDGYTRAYHSQPLFQGFEGRIARLADHLGTSISNHVPESPNRLSEDLVHFMAAIYCKLADPPLPQVLFPNSPTSSLASSTIFSPQVQSNKVSDISNIERVDAMLVDPFGVKANKESVGGYGSMIEVPWICVDNERLTYAAQMLHNFKSLVRRLEKIEPALLKHEEKLAFWINIYNTLMMHAYLAYGIPRSQLKRVRLLQKAAYKIGGYSVNAHMIETVILGCKLHRPAQWLQSFLLGGSKSKAEELRSYGIEQSEPLVCFALCSGSYSDPAVRVYTAKCVHQELEVAKDEYLKATVSIKTKLMLPRILEGYSRDLSLNDSDLVNIASKYLSETQRNAVKKTKYIKLYRSFEWIPYNFNFRYIFSRELGKWIPPMIT